MIIYLLLTKIAIFVIAHLSPFLLIFMIDFVVIGIFTRAANLVCGGAVFVVIAEDEGRFKRHFEKFYKYIIIIEY